MFCELLFNVYQIQCVLSSDKLHLYVTLKSMLNGKNADETFTQIWFGEEKCGFVCYNADESEAGIELMKVLSHPHFHSFQLTNGCQ